MFKLLCSEQSKKSEQEYVHQYDVTIYNVYVYLGCVCVSYGEYENRCVFLDLPNSRGRNGESLLWNLCKPMRVHTS